MTQRSPLSLDDRRWSPLLIRRADRGLYLDPHPVQGSEQGSVLLPDSAIRTRLRVQDLGEAVAAEVHLGESLVDLGPGNLW